MRTTVHIDNLNHAKAEMTIYRSMLSVKGISNVSLNITTNEVSFSYTTHNALEGMRETLAAIGYPITMDPSVIL